MRASRGAGGRPATLRYASSNPGKLAEYRAAAAVLAGQGLAVEPLPGLDGIAAPDETGATFEDNAAAKALHYSAHTGDLLFAEDAGLEVRALGGAPGVHSARFAGPTATADDNNRLLLARLRGVVDRRARFVCVTAVAQEGRLLGSFRGECAGVIGLEPRGSCGFGYDPLFVDPASGRTFAEMSHAEKWAVSHRRLAFERLLAFLAQR